MKPLEIIFKLQHKGFQAYYIGGAVRDMLMGLDPKDFDIVTSARPDEIIDIFKDQKIKEVGKSFGVVLIDEIEVATYRTDKYHGLNDKNCEIKYADSLEEDTSRRDLTINQIAYDPIAGKFIDYHKGLRDLNDKMIRFIGDPRHRIFEDPNRIIRACRFKAKIDGDFDSETFEHLKQYSDYIDTVVAPERIRLEILKAMTIKKASIFFNALNDIGGLIYVLPSLQNCYLHPGGPYHIEDVFDHCMMSGDHAHVKNPLIKLAAYLHDVGKPISSRINPRTDDLWFEGHDETGCGAIINDLTNLKFSNEEIAFVSRLAKNHMRINHERIGPKGIRRTLKTLSDDGLTYKDLVRVAICDKMGGLKGRVHYKLRDIYDLVKVFKTEINRKAVSKFSELTIDGFEVMELTGLKPGKEVGEILKWLLDLVVDDPELNEKEILMEFVRRRKHFL